MFTVSWQNVLGELVFGLSMGTGWAIAQYLWGKIIARLG